MLCVMCEMCSVVCCVVLCCVVLCCAVLYCAPVLSCGCGCGCGFVVVVVMFCDVCFVWSGSCVAFCVCVVSLSSFYTSITRRPPHATIAVRRIPPGQRQASSPDLPCGSAPCVSTGQSLAGGHT